MQLLVSVRNASEAAAAQAGGADVIDAKDPGAGALGAVDLRTFREIHRATDACPVSAALGDAADEAIVERDAAAFAAAGAAFVKIGFAGITSAARAERLLRAAVRGSRNAVAVAYADREDLSRDALLDLAGSARARGVLLDTADKTGPGLPALIARDALARWVSRARGHGLLVALAGRLTAGDMRFIRDVGADIVGVRGAACAGGRSGVVTEANVQALKALI